MSDATQFGTGELDVLLRELNTVLEAQVPGDVVELGCYKGDTSVQIARLLKQKTSDKKLYLYDSFEGLPAKQPQDESPIGALFKAGELPATKREVISRLRHAGFTDVHIRKAWFSDLGPDDLPEIIAFAFLDGDFYQSIMDSLRLIWPKLAPGAVIVVDDYANEALPGAARAVDEWAASHPAKISIEKSLAVLKVQYK